MNPGEKKAREETERKTKLEAERKEREAARAATREAEETAKREAAEKDAKAAAAKANQSRSSSGKSSTSTPKSPQSTRPPLPGLPPVPIQLALPPPPMGHMPPGKGGMMSGIGRGKLPASLPPHIPPSPLTFGKGPMPNGPPRPPSQPMQGPPYPLRGMVIPHNGPPSPQVPFPRPPSGGQIPGHLGGPMGPLGPMTHAIPAKPVGFNTLGHPPGPSTTFGAIGLGPAPTRPPPPFTSTSGIAHSPRTSLSGPSGQVHPSTMGNRPPSVSSNGSAAIGPLTLKVSNPSVASSTFGATSSLAALNMNSQLVERKTSGEQSAGPIGPPPGHQKRVSQDFKMVQPIGPPRAINGNNLSDPEDASAPSSSTSASLRSPSPPPILGSAALLEDLEEDESLGLTPDVRRLATAAPIGAPFYGTGSIWGNVSHPNGGWQADPSTLIQAISPSPPPVSRPNFDRQTIIADRGRIAFKHVAESYGTGRSHFSAPELHRMCLSLYPDSSSVDVNEFVSACMSKGEKIWDIRMDGSQYLMRFVGMI